MEKFFATVLLVAVMAVLWAWIAAFISRCNGGKKKKNGKPSLPAILAAEEDEYLEEEEEFWRGFFED